LYCKDYELTSIRNLFRMRLNLRGRDFDTEMAEPFTEDAEDTEREIKRGSASDVIRNAQRSAMSKTVLTILKDNLFANYLNKQYLTPLVKIYKYINIS
jgi:hypothetical protein